MSYNKDIDYQKKIDESVNAGDYKAAAKYEKERNEKIDGEDFVKLMEGEAVPPVALEEADENNEISE